MPYKILKHSADIKLEVTGKTLEELFKSALEAMSKIMLPNPTEKPPIKREISVTAPDSTILLIDFLNEVLENVDIYKEVYTDIFFLQLTDNKIEAEIYGIHPNAIRKNIKAVTFHEADIARTKDGWLKTKIVFDI
ncbi:MAG: archease [Candidatus Peregrinibacteria bacterium]